MDNSLQAVRDYVRAFVEVQTQDMADFLIDAWTQLAFDDLIGTDVRWPFYEVGTVNTPYQITTVTGQQNYAMPVILPPFGSDYQAVQSATVDAHKIVAIQGPHWELLYADQTALESTFTPAFMVSQEPERYSYWGQDGITLWPIPNAVYVLNVRAYREPKPWIDLGAGGQMDAPNDFFGTMLAYVLAQAMAQQTDLQQAGYWDAQYQQGKTRLVRKYLRAPMPENMRMNGGQVTRELPPRLRFPFEGLNSVGLGG